MKIILASGSPRRRRLLRRIVEKFGVREARISERIRKGEPFRFAATRLAEKKARKVALKNKGAVVIGADTIACRGGEIYRKTDDARVALKILKGLSGKTHSVVTGVAVLFPDGKAVRYAVRASVKLRELNRNELASYLRTGEWKGRAGCYDVSGKGRRLVESIKGERETVVGLPLKRLRKLLKN